MNEAPCWVNTELNTPSLPSLSTQSCSRDRSTRIVALGGPRMLGHLVIED